MSSVRICLFWIGGDVGRKPPIAKSSTSERLNASGVSRRLFRTSLPLVTSTSEWKWKCFSFVWGFFFFLWKWNYNAVRMCTFVVRRVWRRDLWTVKWWEWGFRSERGADNAIVAVEPSIGIGQRTNRQQGLNWERVAFRQQNVLEVVLPPSTFIRNSQYPEMSSWSYSRSWIAISPRNSGPFHERRWLQWWKNLSRMTKQHKQLTFFHHILPK